MRKTKALSGAAQDAYFRRALKTQSNLTAEDREQLVRSLKREIAQLRLRLEPLPAGALPPPAAAAPVHTQEATSAQAQPAVPSASFDPFSPNVVVILRTSGRAAALAALAAIDREEHLRLLAREQRLNVGPDVASLRELRAAIVSAAERRVANRVAAAS
ncbi:MAG TPA: hypothetical protein VN523_03425 [Hyphomicrobiaceae bacterium]|jgi:hypothetical protein|nr:hypothetical protein [Hyphomicrobiaceae bacterium]